MITVNTGDSPELEAFLAQRIYEHNAAVTGYNDAESFTASHQREGGGIDAGISGYTWGGCCYVSYLWVAQAFRRIGIGGELLDAVERHARSKRCRLIVVGSHTFQAPDFYARRGYQPVARIDDYPVGHADIFFTKRLEFQRTMKPHDIEVFESEPGGMSVLPTPSRALARLLAFAIPPAAIALAARADEPRLVTRAGYASILSDLTTPADGSGNADVTIVEWFDYDCPFCRRTHPHLKEALRTDSKIRILYKEWPVFGEVSAYAAQSALAANFQGKYLQAHDALISTPESITDKAHVNATLQAAGIDMARLSRDREAHAAEIAAILTRSNEEAAQLGLKGTPGFLIGRQFVPRSLDLSQLRQLIVYARAPQ
ncbi:MAG TPA: GNAT family N-acetyltransferase [Povalibacter sp.]|nr:GNAT family N-acetyltransferase [Povalibacter sp.]